MSTSDRVLQLTFTITRDRTEWFYNLLSTEFCNELVRHGASNVSLIDSPAHVLPCGTGGKADDVC